MLDKSQFNQQEYDNYINNYRYDEAADYLEQFQMDNDIDQAQYKYFINSLRTEGSRYNRLVDLSKNGQAVRFSQDISNGVLNDTDNKYTNRYKRVLNKVGVNPNNNQQPNYYKVAFTDSSVFDAFLTQSGYDKDDLQSKGISYIPEDGKVTIKFDRAENKDLYHTLYSLAKIQGGGNFTIKGFLKQNDGNDIDLSINNNAYMPSSYSRGATSFNLNKTEVSDIYKNTYYPELQRLANIIDHTNSILSNAELQMKNDVISNTIIAKDFKTAGHAKLDELRAKGLSKQDYEGYVKKLDDIYKSRIILEGFSDRDIYLADGEVYTKLEKQKDRLELKQYLSAILGNETESNRFTYRAAMSGNMIGTIITVSPDTNNDGSITNKKYKNTKSGVSVFIPDLFHDECEQSLRRDTQIRSVLDYNNLVSIQNTQYLYNGNRIKDVNNDGGLIYYKEIGEWIPASREQILQQLNEDNLMKDGINRYSYLTNEINKVGNKNIEIEEYIDPTTGKPAINPIEYDIRNYTYDAVKDLGYNENTPEFDAKWYDFYIRLLKSVDSNITPTLKLKSK